MPCTVGSQSQTWFFRRLALVCTYSRTTSAIIRKGKPALSLSEVSLSPILRQHPLLRKGKQANIELSTFAFSSLPFTFNNSRTTSTIKKRKTCLHRIEHFHFLNSNFHLFLENIHYQVQRKILTKILQYLINKRNMYVNLPQISFDPYFSLN